MGDEGCLKLEQSGLKWSGELLGKATGWLQREMDILGPFIIECCFKRDWRSIGSKNNYIERYANWCFSKWEHPIKKNRAFWSILETQVLKIERATK